MENLPSKLAQLVIGYQWETVGEGCSDALVYRLLKPSLPVLYLKIESLGVFAETPHEAKRLKWLGTHTIGCPKVIAEFEDDLRYWLLLSAVPGTTLAEEVSLSPEQTINVVATALRALHNLSVANCPFNSRLDVKLRDAKRRLAAGLVDELDFDDERMGVSANALLARLLSEKPVNEDLVVTHGDATFENMLSKNGVFSGFVDCSRLGIADRYQDLALACRSIRHKFGVNWERSFLALYGIENDEDRIAYFQALDEFF